MNKFYPWLMIQQLGMKRECYETKLLYTSIGSVCPSTHFFLYQSIDVLYNFIVGVTEYDYE